MDTEVPDKATDNTRNNAAESALTGNDSAPSGDLPDALHALIVHAETIRKVFDNPSSHSPSAEEPSYVDTSVASRGGAKRHSCTLSPLGTHLRSLSRLLLEVIRAVDSPAERAALLSALDNSVSGARLEHARDSVARANSALEARDSPRERDFEKIDPLRVAADITAIEQRCPVSEATRRVSAAVALHDRFPRLLERVERGDLPADVAGKIARSLADIEDRDTLSTIEGVIIHRMHRDTSPAYWSGYLSRQLDAIIAEAAPAASGAAERKARSRRHVSRTPVGSGMALLNASLPALDGELVMSRLTSVAKSWHSANDGRSVDELRADALVHLVTGRDLAPEGSDAVGSVAAPPIHPRITLVADSPGSGNRPRAWAGGGSFVLGELTTLLERSSRARLRLVPLGDDDAPPTHESIRDSLARFTASLTRQTTYSPSTALRLAVTERDGTCRHPGCAVAAERCDLDHVVPFDHASPLDGGLTREDNLVALCRSHHRLKTHGNASYSLRTDGRVSVDIGTDCRGGSMPHGSRGLARDRHDVRYSASTAPTVAEAEQLLSAARGLVAVLRPLVECRRSSRGANLAASGGTPEESRVSGVPAA